FTNTKVISGWANSSKIALAILIYELSCFARSPMKIKRYPNEYFLVFSSNLIYSNVSKVLRIRKHVLLLISRFSEISVIVADSHSSFNKNSIMLIVVTTAGTLLDFVIFNTYLISFVKSTFYFRIHQLLFIV